MVGTFFETQCSFKTKSVVYTGVDTTF